MSAANYRAAEKSDNSIVEAIAYRVGEEVPEYLRGIKHDYRRKKGVVHKEIMLPENAPREFESRSVLWNTVEIAEKRKDARTAREVELALPREFDLEEQIEVLREYVSNNFVDAGMCADFAIHDKGDGNPHAHILLTTRNVLEDGFGGKNRDWDKVERLKEWRENWAQACNERLADKGLDERIDHRTLEAQGIDREPTIHVGRSPERARRNEEIKRRNEQRRIAREQSAPEAVAERLHTLKWRYWAFEKEISGMKRDSAHAAHSDKLAMLIEKRDAFKVEYQRQKLLVETNSDKQLVFDKLKQMESQGESVRERLARMQSERALDFVTERDFRAILEHSTPRERRALTAYRERERVRDWTRGR